MPNTPSGLTPELVARMPRPGMVAPGAIAYSPDGSFLTYLFSERGDLVRDLWRLELKTGRREKWLTPPDGGESEANMSREGALRRERQRIQTAGITHYAWAEDAHVLVLPIRDTVYRWRDDTLVRLVDHATDPRASSDGKRVFFIREGEVWYVDEEVTAPLTSGAEPGITNGLAEFIAQEELDRHEGFWPSPDGTLVAFEQADERHIAVYPIVHQATDTPEVEEHRYAFAGGANARIKLGVASVSGAPVAWLDLGPDEDLYLARVDWHPDGRLFVQLLSRDQRRLELKSFDPGLWSPSTLLVEESPTWVNLHDDLRFVKETGEFTWSSERSGYRHLSLHGPDGALLRQLTRGEWPVDGVRGIDEKGRQLYFAASTDTPLESHLYRVSLDGGDAIRMTMEPGMHHVVVARDGSSFVDLFDSRNQPPSCVLRQPDGTVIWTLHDPPAIELNLPVPEVHAFKNRDGVTLYAAVFLPAAKSTAVIVDVYGGPRVQAVTDSWALTVNLRAQLLAAHGFVVVQVDNRGSSRRGVAFESAVAKNLGDIEIRDQTDAVRWLGESGLADLTRVGIYGWSYGGYLAAMALVKAPDVFTVAVAGAPVTSWDGYDTGYTERYMGTPESNPHGYRASSVMTHADRLSGKLMLVHGLLDENVHFRHSARLMQALIDADKPFDVMLYPNERHMPRSLEDRVAMENRILDYFMTHLAPAPSQPSGPGRAVAAGRRVS